MFKKLITWLNGEPSKKDWEYWRPLSQATGELLELEAKEIELKKKKGELQR